MRPITALLLNPGSAYRWLVLVCVHHRLTVDVDPDELLPRATADALERFDAESACRCPRPAPAQLLEAAR